jgi:hypothetical protein
MRALNHALLACWIAASVAGCSAGLVNHTATTDVTATDPRFVDGDTTTYATTEVHQTRGMGEASEAIVTLAAPRAVSKMVVHSPDLLSFEVFTRDMDSGEWVSRAYHQSYKAPATKETAVRLKGRPRTDAVLLRVLRTTDDTKNRAKVLTTMNRVYELATDRGQGAYNVERGIEAVDEVLARAASSGDLHGAATIHEIVLFGPAHKPE